MEKYVKTEIDRVELYGLFMSRDYINYIHEICDAHNKPPGAMLLCNKNFAKDVLHIKWPNPFYQENREDAVPV